MTELVAWSFEVGARSGAGPSLLVPGDDCGRPPRGGAAEHAVFCGEASLAAIGDPVAAGGRWLDPEVGGDVVKRPPFGVRASHGRVLVRHKQTRIRRQDSRCHGRLSQLCPVDVDKVMPGPITLSMSRGRSWEGDPMAST